MPSSSSSIDLSEIEKMWIYGALLWNLVEIDFPLLIYFQYQLGAKIRDYMINLRFLVIHVFHVSTP